MHRQGLGASVAFSSGLGFLHGKIMRMNRMSWEYMGIEWNYRMKPTINYIIRL
jgi:hypothetical protein